jgi:hypothetical protein
MFRPVVSFAGTVVSGTVFVLSPYGRCGPFLEVPAETPFWEQINESPGGLGGAVGPIFTI